MPHFSEPFCCQRLLTLAFYLCISQPGAVLGPRCWGRGAGAGGLAEGCLDGSRQERGCLGAPLARGGGSRGLTLGVGPCPFTGPALLGNWDGFYWRKGKAGHAMDSSSGLFLTAIQAAAVLLSAQPVTLGHFRGLEQWLPLHSTCPATPRHNTAT